MAAGFNHRDKTRVQPQAIYKRTNWIKEVETVPLLQMLLHDNKAIAHASQIYQDKSHWYSITGINSCKEQTPISAFTGDTRDSKYCIHGEVGKLVAQQLQNPNKIRAGINGHQSTEPTQLEYGGERLIDSRKPSKMREEFIKKLENENIDLESTLIPLSIEDQMKQSNIKIISLSPQQELPPQVESEPCPFDLHSWNRQVKAITDSGYLYSFSSINSSKLHETIKPFDKSLRLPVKTVKRVTKSHNQQIYLLADDGTTKPLKTKQHIKSQPVKDVITLISDQLSKMQNGITSSRPLPGVSKFITRADVMCPQRPLTTACMISPCHRTVKEALNFKGLAGEQNLKQEDISVTNPSKNTITKKPLFHFTAKALQCSEEKNVNEKGPAFGLQYESSIPAPELALSLSYSKMGALSSIAHENHELKPEYKLTPIINSKEKPNGNILKSIATDPGAQNPTVTQSSGTTPAPKGENFPVSSDLKSPPASLIIRNLEEKSENKQSMEEKEMKEAVEFQRPITSAGITQSPVNNVFPTQTDNLSIPREVNPKLDEEILPYEEVSLKTN